MTTKQTRKVRKASTTDSLKVGVQSFTALLLLAIVLWQATFWMFFGKPGSYLPAVPTFLLVGGPLICLAFTLALTWDYLCSRKKHASVFVMGVATSLSPLFFFGLIAVVALLKSH